MLLQVPLLLLLQLLQSDDAAGAAPPAPGAQCPSTLSAIGLGSRTIDGRVLILLNCGLEGLCVESMESLDIVDEPESECESPVDGEEKEP